MCKIIFSIISVTSAKVKQSNNTYHENTIRDDSSNDLVSSETISRNAEDGDAGVQNQLCAESQEECEEAHKEVEQGVSIKTEEKLNSKDESCDSEASAEHKTVSSVVEEKANEEMNDLSQIIAEKLKFLSEGREGVSAVQTMQIQLQVSMHFSCITYTLFLAFKYQYKSNINYCIYYRHYLLHGRQVA